MLIRREPTNSKDNNAVVFLEDVIVGHVPYNLVLEVPCVYRLYGPKVYIEKMRELVNSCVCPFEGGCPLLGGSVKRAPTVIGKCM